MKQTLIMLFMLLMPFVATDAGAQTRDSDQLGMAIDYFQGRKYHEALLLFEKLSKRYKLNPRFLAYMGVCYYYEWEYGKATELLDSVMPKMEVFAPHERSVYYYCDAESHFQLEEYEQAIPLYEKMLGVCYENEKPDAYYRMGFCYLLTNDKTNAEEYLSSALAYYKKYRQGPDSQARIQQLERMVSGLQAELIQRNFIEVDSSPTDTIP